MTDALSEMCDDSSFCSYVTIKSYLSQLQGNCSDELKPGSSNVETVTVSHDVILSYHKTIQLTRTSTPLQLLYDALYITVPFHNAICAKDSDDGSCLAKIAQASDTSSKAEQNNAVQLNAVGNIGAANATTSTFSKSTYSFGAVIQAAKNPKYLFVQAGKTLAKRLVRRGPEDEDDDAASSSSAAPSSASESASQSGSAQQSSSASKSESEDKADSSSSDSADANTSNIGAVADDTSDKVLGDISMPNSTTFTSTNLPFLFMSSSMTSDVLCSDCTKQILAQYIAFENKVPYAQGLSNSLLLSGQASLYKGIGAKCGDGFVKDIDSTAGSVNLDSSAMPALPSAFALAAVLASLSLLL